MMDYVPGALRLNLFTCASNLRIEHDKEQEKNWKNEMKKGSAEHIQDGNFVFLSTLSSVTLVLNTLTDGACFQD